MASRPQEIEHGQSADSPLGSESLPKAPDGSSWQDVDAELQ